MLNNKISKSVRLAIMFGATASATAGFNAVAAEEDESAKKVERIEVTGSRIKRTDLETAVPVTTLSRAEIGETGTLNIQDILSKSPVALAGSDQSSSAFSTTSVGLNTTSLRGLGEERTLILVNGRRFVSGQIPSSGYAVDLNAIPAKLIERIDILKSASSAIYGSDAVAGVVNIILRDDIEGVEVSAQSGISGESDREQHSVTVVSGGSWDKGNAWVAFGYDKDAGLVASERDFSQFDLDEGEDENGNPMWDQFYSSYSEKGRITVGSGKDAKSFTGDGTPYNGATDAFNRAAFRQLVTPLERKYAAAKIKVELSDDVTAFTEFNWNNAGTAGSIIEPTPLDVRNDVWLKNRGGLSGMDINSPLIPEALRAQLQALNITDLNQANAVVRRMSEFGPRDTSLERDTLRVATGVDWNIDDNWALNSYFTYGQTTQTQQGGGQVNIERAALALDVEVVDGVMRCKSEQARLQGCVPFNIFGQGTVSDAAVAYLNVPAKVYGRAEQTVFSSTLTGELPLELAGGNVSMAAGYEYRLEQGVAQPGDLAQTGASSTNKSAATEGSFTTKDIYGELSIPLLENLRVDLAARTSDHSIVDRSTTFNAGIEYRPFESLMVRTSFATAVRTPNIADLFGGRGQTFAAVTDPCNGLKLDGSDTLDATVRANCLSIPEIANRAANSSTKSFELTLAEKQGTGGYVGGNPDVKEETADTFSFGFAYQATDNLSFTVDYFKVNIEDAIATISRSTVVRRCFEQSSAEFSANCGGNALRDSAGVLYEVSSATSNEEQFKTSGVDFDVNYTVDTSMGTFGANLIVSHTIDFDSINQVSGDTTSTLGEITTPKNRGNLNLTYKNDDLTLRWRLRYWDAVTDANEDDKLSVSRELSDIGAYVYHDLSASYNVGQATMVTAGVRNLGDKQPAILGQSANYGFTGINTNTTAYDVTGRYYYVGFETKF